MFLSKTIGDHALDFYSRRLPSAFFNATFLP